MKPFQRIGLWLFALAVALLCFWPALTQEFGVHNDYSVFTYDKKTVIFDYPESAHLAAIGRPLGAVLLNLNLYPINTIADFTTSRWCCFLVILFSAWLLARHLRVRVQMSSGLAACAALCVCVLPANQLFVYWVTNFVPGALNVLIALLIYEVLDQVRLAEWRGWRRLKVIGCAVLATVLFLCSLCIYPATALFILVPTCGSVIFSPIELWPETRRRLLRDATFTIAGMAAFFVLLRFLIRPVMGHFFPQIRQAMEWVNTGLYELAIERNVFVWAANFCEVMNSSLIGSLHSVLFFVLLPAATVTVLFCILLAGAWRLYRVRSTAIAPRVERGYLLQAGVAVLALLALSECPIIVAAGTSKFTPYRVIFPASAMIAMLLCAIVSRLRLPLPSSVPAFFARPLPACLAVTCAGLGHLTLAIAAGNAQIELTTLRQQLKDMDLHSVRGVQIVGPPPAAIYAEGVLRADFRIQATGGFFSAGLVNAVLAENGIPRGKLIVRHVSLDPTAESLAIIDGMALVDMNVGVPKRRRKSLPSRRINIGASAETCEIGNLTHAFDWDPNSFWEANGTNQWLRVDYEEPYRLAEYTLGTMTPPERTPLDWQVLGSDDGAAWTVIDQQHIEKEWEPNETRAFALAKPAQFRSYKLVFTAGHSEIVRITGWGLLHDRSLPVASKPHASLR